MTGYINAEVVRKAVRPAEYYRYHLVKFNIRKKGEWVLTGLCPFHTDRVEGSFSVNLVTGSFKCFSCGAKGADIISFHRQKYEKTFYQALKELSTGCLATTIDTKQPAPVRDDGVALRSKKIEMVLEGSISIAAPDAEPVRKYLRNRGLAHVLEDLPGDLLFHPALAYYENGKISHHPAMIASLRNEAGDIVTIHRTYLTQDGKKASVNQVRKLMPPAITGSTKGSAVRLYQHGITVGIAEGIETALAVRTLTKLPVWASCSATNLENFKLPTSVQKVMIFADNDESGVGMKSARSCAQRLAQRGIKVKILVPEELIHTKNKFDWLDFLNN